jgi:putative aldouronate transport system substrate-binding protein
MTAPSEQAPLRRRSLFKAAGLGTLGAAGLPLAACGEVSGGEGNVQELDQALDILPEYKEWPLPAQPDLIGEPPHHPSAFLSYPDPVPQAIPNPPSNSGTYEVYVPNWGPTMSRDDPYFQAMKEATGGTKIDFVQNTADTYADAAVQWIKAEEFGDAIFLQTWMAGADANFNETVVNRFANLTGHLSGDIAERWPLLAGRGDDAWADSVWSTDPENPRETAGIYAVPWTLKGGPGNAVYYRADLLAAAGLATPATVEELLDAARAWSDDGAGKWAIAGTDWMSPAWFGLTAGNGWSWDGSGMVHNFERPEYKDWVAFHRTLTDEKLRHPGVGSPDFDSKAAQRAGEVLVDQDGWNRWPELTAEVRTTGENPDFELGVLGALNYQGREPVYHGAHGVDGWLFLSRHLSEDAVAELLDVCNFVASPYGTKEYEMIHFGVEGEHFEYDADGRPDFTEAGNLSKKDSFAYTAMSGVTQVFIDGPPDVVQARFAFDEAIQPYLDEDLFAGLRLTAPESGDTASSVFGEKVNDIIYGRAELSELDAAVETWKADADEARAFYEQAYRQLHGEQ